MSGWIQATMQQNTIIMIENDTLKNKKKKKDFVDSEFVKTCDELVKS